MKMTCNEERNVKIYMELLILIYCEIVWTKITERKSEISNVGK